MAMRFRKSVSLGKGVRLNFGKSSMGVSFGGKHGGLSVNSNTGVRARTSLPGTGISFSENLSSGSKKKKASASAPSSSKSFVGEEIQQTPKKWWLILGIIFVIAGLVNIGDVEGAVLTLILGIALVTIWITKNKTAKNKNADLESTAPMSAVDEYQETSEQIVEPVKSELVTEIFKAAGVTYYEDNIMKLACRTDDWPKNSATLKKEGKLGKKIFRYTYINKPVKLIPEPTNEHDKNAVQIFVAGELVGYISADEAVHVKDILNNRKIKYISSLIAGGQYKIASENGLERFENNLSVSVKISYS